MMTRLYRATPAELPALEALYASLRGWPGSGWNDAYPTPEILRRDVEHGALYCLCEDNGCPVAALTAAPLGDLADLPWDRQVRRPCELARVAVAPACQGQGLAKRLIRLVLATQQAAGYDGACLLVAQGNTAAQALYTRLGFVRGMEVERYGMVFDQYHCRFPAAVVQTDRLLLRHIVPEDFTALCGHLQDPAVMYAYEHAFSDKEVHDWLDRQRTRYLTDGVGLWAMVLRETGQVIGQCGLTWQAWEAHSVLEVGYQLAHAHWHKGYATEAARACVRYAFEELGEAAVHAIIRDTNTASQRVAARLGMAPCGTQVKHYYHTVMPHVVYRVCREKFTI